MTLETENQALLRNAVLQTDTLLLTWPHWLRDDLERGRVVDLGGRLHPVPPAHLLALSCAVVWREDRNLSPAAQQLYDLFGDIRRLVNDFKADAPAKEATKPAPAGK